MERKILLSALFAVALLVLIFSYVRLDKDVTPTPSGKKHVGVWADTELTDVATGREFRISDFKGKPILMESFAVWCSTCLEQQRKTKELRERMGEDIVHVSLDTDPNEDETKVLEHLKTYGFDWYYAVSPVEMTRALIEDFGLDIVNAPAAPMVLICEDQSVRFLRKGVKSADELLLEVNKGC
jgi:cytochrome oxidase Cu insertion factor (SCO1/SenC/PrrC family)